MSWPRFYSPQGRAAKEDTMTPNDVAAVLAKPLSQWSPIPFAVSE
jgi:hypothetical protein